MTIFEDLARCYHVGDAGKPEAWSNQPKSDSTATVLVSHPAGPRDAEQTDGKTTEQKRILKKN
jgi:hypothetical protein